MSKYRQLDTMDYAVAEVPLAEPAISRGRNWAANEARNFELPGSIWQIMAICYALFFAAMFVATARSTAAIFALVVSVVYTAMYFGTAAILNRVGASRRERLHLGPAANGLQTQTGWMSNRAVQAQILIVPVALALFGTAFATVRAMV